MYKEELQKKNNDLLQNQFDCENIPDFIRTYFITLESSTSRISYWSTIKKMLVWMQSHGFLEGQTLADITPESIARIEYVHLIQYFTEEEANGIARSTLYIRRKIFCSFWDYLVLMDSIPVQKNKARAVRRKKPQTDTRKRKCPTLSEIEQMESNIAHKNDDFVRIRNLSILHVLLETGLRESELANLDIDDLYLNGGPWDERPYIAILGKGCYRAEDKRPVLITRKAINAFRDWKKVRDTVESNETKAVFLNKNGKRLNEENIKAIFRNYSGTMTPHMCRHWYSTVMTPKWGDIFVSQQLGHHTGNITKDVYINATYGVDLMAE